MHLMHTAKPTDIRLMDMPGEKVKTDGGAEKIVSLHGILGQSLAIRTSNG